MGLKDIEIKSSYVGRGDKILNEFLLPVMTESVRYDRVTSFYSVNSLLAISQGIQSLYDANGEMRLIIGIHSFPPELIDASLRHEYMLEQISEIRKELKDGIASLSDLLEKKRLATLAWMIQDGLLQVKAAAVADGGLFHPKTLIISDEDDTVAAIGSPNETPWGLGSNFEQIMVAKSWENEEAVTTQIEFFESLWNNDFEDLEVLDITEETAEIILSSLGGTYRNPKHSSTSKENIISSLYKMPANYFVSGDIPALFMHQERAVIDALSRWPVRVLFADEVGLGKTFETAATLAYLMKYCGIKRVVILTPKSVLSQWQDELYEHFKIDAWLYDSSNKKYISASNKEIRIGYNNPLGQKSPNIILMSSQYARGNNSSPSVFDRDDCVLPELLVVDEAHSARISEGFHGKKKTLLYCVLERVCKKIPHVILATATPMQKDADEYHALLNILGLPQKWSKTRNYQTSLRIITSEEAPAISDASAAADLLMDSLKNMNPSLRRLNDIEVALVEKLQELNRLGDSYDTGSCVMENWAVFKPIFIKLHPAHLLTIRNTRRSLAAVGYRFPVRNLNEESITDSAAIELFYDKVNRYLSEECFSIEKELYPERKKTIGFLKMSYQQRVASSLYSCQRSLVRRFEKVKTLERWLSRADYLGRTLGVEFGLDTVLDDIDLDDYLALDFNELDDMDKIKADDIPALKRAVSIESATLSGLIDEAVILLKEFGDKKITKSISLAINCAKTNDAVLVFSRYTDTIDALINEFNDNNDCFSYGIYTGQRSSIVVEGIEQPCDKNRIKTELFAGTISIVFCSDAASEGLNLQAARVLINVDVPWTPARLEQRIGRIARLGQTADEVEIYNVWYPNSIEARMYHRIQRRLEESNMAIGEFPEVVATSIKDAVLDDSDTDITGLDELIAIRNSAQVSALEELWSIESEGKTTSKLMRERMISLCDKSFMFISDKYDSQIKTYKLPDDTYVDLSCYEGLVESISLSSNVWKYIDCVSNDIEVINREKNKPVAFAIKTGALKKCLIKHESVLKLIIGEALTEADVLVGYPQMLPDHRRLSLNYSIDCEVANPPCMWMED